MKRGRIKKKEEVGYSKLPVIGKVKIGKKNDKGYPTSLDYFVATGKYEAQFNSAYPDKPDKISIFFISDELEEVCDERFEIRGSDGRLYGWGDGEDFMIWDYEKKEHIAVSSDKDEARIKELRKLCGSSKGWEAVLTLRFIIPKIRGVMGVWQISTKGVATSIPAITRAFDLMIENLGTIRMVPFDLQVEMVKSQKPESTARFPVIRLIPNIGTENIEEIRNFLDAGGNIMQLPKLITGEKQKQIGGDVQIPSYFEED